MSPSKSQAPAHPADDAADQVCTLRIQLQDTDPPIWREVEVPISVTLKVLHDIVQIAMGWCDQHLWEFRIGGRIYGKGFGADWGGPPRTEPTKVRLRDVLKPRRTTIDYLYDFGDSWEHRLTVTNVRPGDPAISYPHYVGGERGCPPEDCGGVPGYYAALDALDDPNHPDHAEIAKYLEGWDRRTINVGRLRLALGRIANRLGPAQKKARVKPPS